VVKTGGVDSSPSRDGANLSVCPGTETGSTDRLTISRHATDALPDDGTGTPPGGNPQRDDPDRIPTSADAAARAMNGTGSGVGGVCAPGTANLVAALNDNGKPGMNNNNNNNNNTISATISNNNNNNDGGAVPKVCAGCGTKIVDRFLLHAMERYWHTGCLKCSCCQAHLGEIGRSCFTKAGMILCKHDYIR